MVYGTQRTIATGANLNQLITGGGHIVASGLDLASGYLTVCHGSYGPFIDSLPIKSEDFPYIGNFITPPDELIFFRGVGIPPTR